MDVQKFYNKKVHAFAITNFNTIVIFNPKFQNKQIHKKF